MSNHEWPEYNQIAKDVTGKWLVTVQNKGGETVSAKLTTKFDAMECAINAASVLDIALPLTVFKYDHEWKQFKETVNPDLNIPDQASSIARKAANLIIEYAKEVGDADPGGCKTFYSPKEWKDKGEQFGTASELIVCHDGGAFAPIFNWDYGRYELWNGLSERLKEIGCHAEQCTAWYSAIYLNQGDNS